MVWLVYFDWKCGLFSGGWHSAPVIKERYSVIGEVLFYTVKFYELRSSYGRALQFVTDQCLKQQWNIVSIKSNINFSAGLEYCVSISEFGGLIIWIDFKVASFCFIDGNVIYGYSNVKLLLNGDAVVVCQGEQMCGDWL